MPDPHDAEHADQSDQLVVAHSAEREREEKKIKINDQSYLSLCFTLFYA